MTSPEQIDLWRSAKTESANLEFKEAKNQYNFISLCEYCVALANEGGGYLVLGVVDKPPRPVVGSAAFINPNSNAHRVLHKIGFRVEFEEVDHPDGRVVVVSIPSRPRGTAYAFEGRYLMRSGESLVSMTEDRLRTIFDEGNPDWLEETSRGGMSGQEVIDSLDTQAFFELMEESFPTDQEAVLARLESERLIDRDGEFYCVRRIGGILLARSLANFPDLERKAPRVVVYNGNSKLETKLDQKGSSGYAVSFQRLVNFVMSHLSQNEVVEDAIRREVKMVPDIVIRELVANALIHQDFAMTGTSVMIEIYDDRLEISNPGIPVVDITRFIDAYESRNERLADIMRRFGVCEEKGSGIDKVINAAEMYQLPAPDFSVEYNRTAVIVFGPKPFENMDKKERIRACFQHAALKRVMRDYMTNQSLRQRFNLPDSKSATISQIITAAVDEGLIKPDESVGASLKLRRYLPHYA